MRATGYREIARQLATELDDPGRYPPGTQIDTIDTLMSRFRVSKITIQRALDVLKAEGRLVSSTTRGHRVPHPRIQIPISRYGQVLDPARVRADLGPWETALHDQGLVGHGDVYLVDRTEATTNQALALQVQAGSTLVGRHRHMTIDTYGLVAQIQHAWMPLTLIEGTPLADPADIPGGVYAVMTAHNIHPHRVRETVSARTVRGDEGDQLGLPQGAPVMELWRITFDRAANPIEYLQVITNPAVTAFVYDLPISPPR